ncbi:Gfo/Idh/MocA family protein [Stagnihabitans tardus]|uniref:Gfo/Idh/MocA family oxidoreductase n=1 Tax=Stagnihabitans tardus TaxID=2699202 RepID=A0AAE5BY48_9RHOB|nr:Gfo/Idh/MocA family oxidoreductase [Stagnihabitans tardus]NBZ90003.1 Gfo/Idh/MocA family oxidoreductase [Stagnihabitans tardus]
MARWGILGPGYIAGLFAEDLARAGARLSAVASRDLGRAQAFAAKHGVPRAHGSYEALAADPEVDVVYIASPHSHHHEHARLMLSAGKHLLVEKPFTMNAAQAHDLIALAREKGLFIMDALWTLCNPLYRLLQARVAAGEIGTPRAFAAQIGPMGTGDNTRILDPAQGGSFTLECLTYPLNILAGLAPGLTKGASVSAQGLLTTQGVDSAATVTLKTAQGYASMAGGFVPGTGGMGGSGFQLIGDKGWLAVTDNLFNPGKALFSTGAGVEELTDTGHEARYGWEIAEVQACLSEGRLESTRVPHGLTLEVMGLLDQALQHIRGRVLA